MHAYLTRLGVPDAVQIFFQPFYTVDPSGTCYLITGMVSKVMD